MWPSSSRARGPVDGVGHWTISGLFWKLKFLISQGKGKKALWLDEDWGVSGRVTHLRDGAGLCRAVGRGQAGVGAACWQREVSTPCSSPEAPSDTQGHSSSGGTTRELSGSHRVQVQGKTESTLGGRNLLIQWKVTKQILVFYHFLSP